MLEAYAFPATSQTGATVTLLALIKIVPDEPQSTNATFLLEQIDICTADGRAVNYMEGQLVCPDGDEVLIPHDHHIIDLLKMGLEK